ncbi:hypothetical protein J2Z83_002630 [Virgibacillus natechei]|uniref:Heme exporter protein D n=1 Tax=Virgibacillus natechei TaxID=1216297 RepID=A0ABS4IKH2_9BACI|nr:hypothetical protein [Virgibacillus natechei]MBP1970509.1 hypothetical protein [Virgibacillus natechei]UZD14086.1 hypothetical protein OLD84_06090 [Virgibacillus natechei]
MGIIRHESSYGAYVVTALFSFITFKTIKKIEAKKLELKDEIQLQKEYKNGI